MKSSDVLQPLILREVYPKAVARAAALEVERICQTIDHVGGRTSLETFCPNTVMVWSLQRGVCLGMVRPDAIENVYNIMSIMNEIIGYKCDPHESSMRTQVPDSSWPKLPWHQDGAGMRPAEDSIVSWVPLTPIDGNCPTIEFAKSQMKGLLEHERNSNFFLETDNKGESGSTIVTGLEPGDVVIFSPWTLHRTYRTRDMKGNRVSLDLRFYQ